MAIPDSITWKAFRAQVHLNELQNELQRYLNTSPGRLVGEPTENPDEVFASFQPHSPIPGRIPMIIGDCIQNLRSSLDYLVWELVIASGNVPGRNNMFPIFSTLESFEKALKSSRLKGVNADAVAEIRKLQPHQHEGDFDKAILWVLDDLCNINKHRRVLTTYLCGGPAELELKTVGGELFGRVDFSTVKTNARLGPFPVVDGPRGRGVLIAEKLTIVAYVAFDEGCTKNLDAGMVLAGMLKFVTTTALPPFERFFS